MQLNTAIVRNNVAPHVGAWIETLMLGIYFAVCLVAPHVGAWIETPSAIVPSARDSRSPCGSVD